MTTNQNEALAAVTNYTATHPLSPNPTNALIARELGVTRQRAHQHVTALVAARALVLDHHTGIRLPGGMTNADKLEWVILERVRSSMPRAKVVGDLVSLGWPERTARDAIDRLIEGRDLYKPSKLTVAPTQQAAAQRIVAAELMRNTPSDADVGNDNSRYSISTTRVAVHTDIGYGSDDYDVSTLIVDRLDASSECGRGYRFTAHVEGMDDATKLDFALTVAGNMEAHITAGFLRKMADHLEGKAA